MTRLLELAIGVVFAAAAVAKLASKPGPESTTIVDSLGRGGQWILILCECALAIWFFSSRGLIVGSVVSTAILSCFTAVLICELYRPIPRDCGCFGHHRCK